MIGINNRYHLQSDSSSCSSILSFPVEVYIISACCLLGIIWAIINFIQVENIKVYSGWVPGERIIDKPITKQQESLLLELG